MFQHAELDNNNKYIILEPELDLSVDPLLWWKSKRMMYPTFFRLAMKVLSAQATEVPCERVFSSAGNIIFSDLRKSLLLPETLSDLLFVYFNEPDLRRRRGWGNRHGLPPLKKFHSFDDVVVDNNNIIDDDC